MLDGRYEILRQGVYDERIIERLLRTTILFVCSGNTCRSPMAEGIARHFLAEKLTFPEMELEQKGISVVRPGACVARCASDPAGGGGGQGTGGGPVSSSLADP